MGCVTQPSESEGVCITKGGVNKRYFFSRIVRCEKKLVLIALKLTEMLCLPRGSGGSEWVNEVLTQCK